MSKKIVLSGMQSSGELHIGNYLGALKNWLKLQNEHKCFFFIADYHSLSEEFDPKEKPRQVLNLAIDYLAAGLNPDKCTIFLQSDVPQCTELAWILNTVTPVAYLERMTQFKDKSLKQEKNINLALLSYPVLQAADILMYNADYVPVGNDQDQHVELTRTIAKFFNNKFGETFKKPEGLHSPAPRVMSLTDPDKKMSKSDAKNSYISLNDSPEEVRNKIKKATTDIGKRENGINLSGGKNLLDLLDNISAKKDEIRKFSDDYRYEKLSYSELKPFLAEEIINMLAPMRAKRKKLENNLSYAREILQKGAAAARKIAEKKMDEVKKRIGIDYKY